jgi:xylitol oxidase
MNPVGRNWAGNIVFAARAMHRPTTIGQLQRLVRHSDRIRALGTGHSFSPVADSDGDLVSLDRLAVAPELDSGRATVRIGAGTRYGELAPFLDRHGWALPNLGSLPHIAVVGACATGTHGSGDGNRILAAAVSGLTMLAADGDLVSLARGDEGFDGCVVALGTLGIVTEVTLDLVPTYDMRQWVYRDMAVETMVDRFDEIMASAYSVSVMTDWRDPSIDQVCVKRRTPAEEAARQWLGATLAEHAMHPIRGVDPAHCTQQLGVVGPWHERLPHFRLQFTPSHGEELQSEYLLPRAVQVDALRALTSISDRIAPALQVNELRSVAGDELWLSPAYRQDSLAVHFTWQPDEVAVAAALDVIESVLLPLGARPHWGKVFRTGSVGEQYPRLSDFRRLRDRFDPARKFGNAFVDRYLGR